MMKIFYTQPMAIDVVAVADGSNSGRVVPPSDYYTDVTLAKPRGTNLFYPQARSLLVVLRGGNTKQQIVYLRATDRVQVTIRVQVPVAEFFQEDKIVLSIATLLNIPANRIKFVRVGPPIIDGDRRRAVTNGSNEVVFEVLPCAVNTSCTPLSEEEADAQYNSTANLVTDLEGLFSSGSLDDALEACCNVSVEGITIVPPASAGADAEPILLETTTVTTTTSTTTTSTTTTSTTTTSTATTSTTTTTTITQPPSSGNALSAVAWAGIGIGIVFVVAFGVVIVIVYQRGQTKHQSDKRVVLPEVLEMKDSWDATPVYIDTTESGRHDSVTAETRYTDVMSKPSGGLTRDANSTLHRTMRGRPDLMNPHSEVVYDNECETTEQADYVFGTADTDPNYEYSYHRRDSRRASAYSAILKRGEGEGNLLDTTEM
jgi:hypothetical protein